MKASNLTTPRSLGDCQFIPSCDPIERPDAASTWSPGFKFIAFVFLAALAVMAVTP